MLELDLFGEVPQTVRGIAARPRRPRMPARTGAGAAPAARYRWFFALRPGAEDAARIHALGDELLAACGIKGKRVAAERLHITLELVGLDVSDFALDAAISAANRIHLPAIDVRMDAAMTFSGRDGAFVLLGAKGLAGMDSVRGLRLMLGCAMADQGFRPPCSFEPHITLGYSPGNRAGPMCIAPVEFRATEFVLIKSHIGRTHHETQRTWALENA